MVQKYIYTLFICGFISCVARESNQVVQHTNQVSKTQIGHMIFQDNCASCHHRSKISTGPALNSELLNTRTNDWIFAFLNKSDDLYKDRANASRVIEFGTTCPPYRIGRNHLESLLSYLRNYDAQY